MLTIFLDRMFVLLLKNGMMKSFSGFFPDFSGLSQYLHISVVLTIFLNKMFGLLLKNDIFFWKSIWFSDFSRFSQNLHILWNYLPEMYPVSWFCPRFFRIFSKSSNFSDSNHNFWHNVCFTSQKWYDEIIFRIFPRFFRTFSISSYFSGFNHIS